MGRREGTRSRGRRGPRLGPARPPALSLQHQPRPGRGGSEPAGLSLPSAAPSLLGSNPAPAPRVWHPLGLIPRGLCLNEPLQSRRGGGRAGVIPKGLVRAESTRPCEPLGTWEQSQPGHKGRKCGTQSVERVCLHLIIRFSRVIWGPQDNPYAIFVRAKPNGQAGYCHALFIDRHLCTCIH